jgi:hypothetical protein
LAASSVVICKKNSRIYQSGGSAGFPEGLLSAHPRHLPQRRRMTALAALSGHWNLKIA